LDLILSLIVAVAVRTLYQADPAFSPGSAARYLEEFNHVAGGDADFRRAGNRIVAYGARCGGRIQGGK
jgi:hypothetical protein